MNTISSMKVPGLTEDKCVTLIGMAGAGKSTVGRAVAERLGWAYVDTDHLIESTYGARLQDVTDALDKERFLDVEAESSSPFGCSALCSPRAAAWSIGPKPCGI